MDTQLDESASAASRTVGMNVAPDSTAPRRVLLSWNGGQSRIHPHVDFPPLDFTDFPTIEGRTLADNAREFQTAVQAQVLKILSELPYSVSVEFAVDSEAPDNSTVVHFTQSVQPNGGSNVGEGEYDPCDLHDDDEAIVYGESLRRLFSRSEMSFEDWVMVFSNVCAHEVAHTFGFGHIPRDEYPDALHGTFVELMLDRHSIEEIRREQRVVVQQVTCSN